MTIEVTIKNSDSRDTAIIGLQVNNSNGDIAAEESTHVLKGGEEKTVYVHSTNFVVVKEIRNG